MVDLILPGFDGEWAGEDYKVCLKFLIIINFVKLLIINFVKLQKLFFLIIKISAIEKTEEEISIETKNGS